MALVNRVGLNSGNRSIPPSQDPSRPKLKAKGGGRRDIKDSWLEKGKHPNVIEKLLIDRTKLPKEKYECIGFVSRQVFDVEFCVP